MQDSFDQKSDITEGLLKWNYEKFGLPIKSIEEVDEASRKIRQKITEFVALGGTSTRRTFMKFDYEHILDLYKMFDDITIDIQEASIYFELESLKDVTKSEALISAQNKIDTLITDVTVFDDNFRFWILKKILDFESASEFLRQHREIDTPDIRLFIELSEKTKLKMTEQMYNTLSLLGDDTGFIKYYIESGNYQIYAQMLSCRKFRSITINDEEGSIVKIECNDGNTEALLSSPSDEVRSLALTLNNEPYEQYSSAYARVFDSHVEKSLRLCDVHGYDDIVDIYSKQLGYGSPTVTRVLEEMTKKKTVEIVSSFLGDHARNANLNRKVERHDVTRRFFDFESSDEERIAEIINTSTNVQLLDALVGGLSPLGEKFNGTIKKIRKESRIDVGTTSDSDRKVMCMCFFLPKIGPLVYTSYFNGWFDMTALVHEIGHMVNYSMSLERAKNFTVRTDFAPSMVVTETFALLNEFVLSGAPVNVLERSIEEGRPITDTGIEEWSLNNERVRWLVFQCIVKQATYAKFEIDSYMKSGFEGEVLTSDVLGNVYENAITSIFGTENYSFMKNESYSWCSVDHVFASPRFYTATYVISCAIAYGIYKKLVDPSEYNDLYREKYERALRQGSRVTMEGLLRRFELPKIEALLEDALSILKRTDDS